MNSQSPSAATEADFVCRPAMADDVAGIQILLNHYASMGELLPRTRQDIVSNLQHFSVIRHQDKIIACGSLEHFSDELAEIRSLMVDSKFKGQGLGAKIVTTLLEKAESRKVRRVMALTYVPEFFHKMGFETVAKEIFPEKIWGICVNCYKFHNCDEIAVLKSLTYQ